MLAWNKRECTMLFVELMMSLALPFWADVYGLTYEVGRHE
jgi:hypothetical protein